MSWRTGIIALINMYFVNISNEPIEVLIMEHKKWMKFHPGIPIDLPNEIGIKYINKNSKLKVCNNPEKYFKDKMMNQLIIRDAGIGDLLLLEPIIRNLGEKNRKIDLLTMYPDVLYGNPYINNIYKQKRKDDLSITKEQTYHVIDDMRNYSEEHPKRHKMHRTDIYASRFGYNIEDKEPRIYFTEKDIPLIKKKKGYTYIGICCDASHGYRSMINGDEIINELLNEKNNIVVVFGEKKIINKRSKRIIDLQGKTTIREAINHIRCLDKMVSPDTGLMHIALALHIPTVCFFSIITSEYRLKYYTGNYFVLKKNISCIGCGDYHMSSCHKGAIAGCAPCQDISPIEVKMAVDNLCLNTENRVFCENEIESKKEDKEINVPNINVLSAHKLTLPIIVQNEEKNLPRFIDLVINNKNIGRVIAIDGGSNDKTVSLLEKAGAEVYIHPYIKTYHEMQAMQRNVSCSYVHKGERILIMDIDECFSKELEEYLPFLAESDIRYGLISRKTFNFYSEITDDSKRIKDYPDWQPRFYTWDEKYKFVRGAHHITLNTPEPVLIKKDILHFEKEGKDRNSLEQQWKTMMTEVRKYA